MNHVVNTRVSGSFNSDHPVIEAIAALASRVSSAVVYFFKTVSQVWAAGRQLISRILFPAHPMTKTVESSGPNLDLAPNPLSLLTSGLGADDRDYVVNETKQISADQRDRAIKYTIPLITKNMGGCERNNVLRAVAAIPKDKPVVVYCLHGIRSQRILKFLRAKGYKSTCHLEGGFEAYLKIFLLQNKRMA